MKSLGFNTHVTRMTLGKPALIMKLKELELGDELAYDDKFFTLVTELRHVGSCIGARARHNGSWYAVFWYEHGVVMVPLEDPNKPFSNPIEEGEQLNLEYIYPLPEDRLEVVIIQEEEGE